jgi:hypothetical protein
MVFTMNGDAYYSGPSGLGPWTYVGNVFSGNPTPAAQPTWGQVKAKYATPAPGKVTR